MKKTFGGNKKRKKIAKKNKFSFYMIYESLIAISPQLQIFLESPAFKINSGSK